MTRWWPCGSWRRCTAATPAFRSRPFCKNATSVFVSSQEDLPAPNLEALGQLAALYGLNTIERQLGDFLEDGYLSGGKQTCPGASPCIADWGPCLTGSSTAACSWHRCTGSSAY